MRTRTTLTALAAGLLALTACNSPGSGDPKPSATTAGPMPTPTPTPQPTTPTPRALGNAFEWKGTEGASGTTTVLGYKHGIRSHGDPADAGGAASYVWAAVEVKVCSTTGSFPVTQMPWTLAFADGARAEPSSVIYQDFPKPTLPYETKLSPGKCVRGNLVFPVPNTPRAQTIVYAPQSLDTTAEWAVPAK